MSERVKVNVKVSSEVNTILHDLFNQIQYEFCEQYEEEIERLTELCNKYEEEHKTTFETWQKDIKENEQLHSIIKEAREKIHDIYFKIDNIPQNHWIGIKLDVTNQGQELLEILDKVEEK